MAQNRQLGVLGQAITVNATSNAVSFNGAVSVGSSFTANSTKVVIGSTIGLQANGGLGSSGQALTTNGSAVYWSTIVGTNTDAQYTWTNTHTFSNTLTSNKSILANTVNATSYTVGSNIVANTTQLTIAAGVALSVNGSVGTANQILTSNGTGAYWATASGGGTTLVSNTTDTQSFYFPMANTTSGSWSNGVVANTKLYFVPSTGTLSATVFNSLSDIEYKTNINTIENALSVVRQLRGVTFNWKEDDRASVGVIAQEVEKVLPDLITTHNQKKSVNYDGLIGVLIEAIKELKQEIESLKTKKE